MVKPLVQATKRCIENLKVNRGDIFKSLPSAIEESITHGFNELTTHKMSKFKRLTVHISLLSLNTWTQGSLMWPYWYF